jgi:hypothetical protein
LEGIGAKHNSLPDVGRAQDFSDDAGYLAFPGSRIEEVSGHFMMVAIQSERFPIVQTRLSNRADVPGVSVNRRRFQTTQKESLP